MKVSMRLKIIWQSFNCIHITCCIQVLWPCPKIYWQKNELKGFPLLLSSTLLQFWWKKKPILVVSIILLYSFVTLTTDISPRNQQKSLSPYLQFHYAKNRVVLWIWCPKHCYIKSVTNKLFTQISIGTLPLTAFSVACKRQ